MILHASRSGQRGNPREYAGTINYVLTPGATSYHYLIAPDGEICELCQPGLAAWHGQEYNHNWLGVAFAQPTIHDPVTEAQHASARWLLRLLCERYEIPRLRLPRTNGPTFSRGIVEHAHTSQGRRSGKSDVGPQLRWELLGL